MGVCKFAVDLERRQREQQVCQYMCMCVHVCVCICLSIQVRKLGEEVNNLVEFGFEFGLPVELRCVVCLPVNRLTLTFKIN